MAPYCVNEKIEKVFKQLQDSAEVRQGLDLIEKDQARTLKDQKEIVIIEAPTFHERQRADDYARRLKESGLGDVEIDEHNNVWGRRPGNTGGSAVLLEAHLDTVFPFNTDVTPKERDGKIYAPGICDDTRGLAANLSVLRALQAVQIETEIDIIFAGTAAEEGLGGMSGMRNLLRAHPEIVVSISIDGPGCDSIVYQATGIRNYEVTYKGPGGHAYSAFGIPSPLHAAARAIASLSDMQPPLKPRTTFTVSLMEGGHQIHAIAQHAVFKINMRSDDQQELENLAAEAIALFEAGAREENARWQSDAVSVSYQKTLDIPAGSQPDDCEIVQAAWMATQGVGITPRLVPGGCTNTNSAIKAGVPAVTLGRGGEEGGTHSLGEWFNPDGVYRASQKSFLLLLALAGVRGVTAPLLTR